MAATPSDAQNAKKRAKERARGMQDDVQILKLIIMENRGLYLRVLDKLRIHRALSSETIFDKAKKKQDQRWQARRNTGPDQ